MFIYRMFKEKCAMLWGNVSYVNLHRYNQTHLYQKLKNGPEVTKGEKISFLVVNLIYFFNLASYLYNVQVSH
jgi:hypothetical protein